MIFCGGNQTGYTNSIERLDVRSEAKGWEVITIPGLPPIDTPGVTALNTQEILILGGTNTKTNRPNGMCIINL